MAFRADEAARIRYEDAARYLVSREINVNPHEAARSREKLAEIVEELGPVIDEYPSWHPLVSNHETSDRVWARRPGERCGYSGLDHNVYFANGFITCPYRDPQKVIDAVNQLAPHRAARITAEQLDVQFYQPSALPVLVRCEWGVDLEDGTVPLAIAMPLFLEKEVPLWGAWNTHAETWESMRPYILGSPHGRRSSLFVNQETGQAMKKVWEALVASGMFGPIYD